MAEVISTSKEEEDTMDGETENVDTQKNMDIINKNETKEVLEEKDGPPAKIATPEVVSAGTSAPSLTFTLVHGHNKHPVTAPSDQSVEDFRSTVEQLTGVPPVMQKLISKGPAMKDGTTLAENKLKDGSRVMLVGSTLTQVIQVNKIPTPDELKSVENKASGSKKEPFSKMKMHTKNIDKGVPDDALPGIKSVKESLPVEPLTGMRNKYNQKTRLTFKLELDQVWIGTPERTEKIPMNQIRSVVSEPIVGHEQYHIMVDNPPPIVETSSCFNFRVFNLVPQNSQDIGFIGCLLNMLTLLNELYSIPDSWQYSQSSPHPVLKNHFRFET